MTRTHDLDGADRAVSSISGDACDDEIYSPGLEGRDRRRDGHLHRPVEGLRYRGYPVTELAEKATFDEVAYLLLHGELPTRPQLADFQKRAGGGATSARAAASPVQALPRGRRRWTCCAARSASWPTSIPDTDDSSRDANLRKAERLLGQIPLAIADHYRIGKGLAADHRRGPTSGTRPTSCTCCAARSRARPTRAPWTCR